MTSPAVLSSPVKTSTFTISEGQYRSSTLEHTFRLLKRIYAKKRLQQAATSEIYTQNYGYQLELGASLSDAQERVDHLATCYMQEFGNNGLVDSLTQLAHLAADILVPLEAVLAEHLKIATMADKEPQETPALPSAVSLAVVSSSLHITINHGSDNPVDAMQMVYQRLRSAGLRPNPEEEIAFYAIAQTIDQSGHIPLPYQPWVTSGFRDYQTYMSITDPGEGHLDGTLLSAENLEGVIVHIEHLERGVQIPRGELEPYRIPSPKTISRIRLALGDDAPSSSYVGRPMFDGASTDFSMLKTIRTFSAALTSLFADGLSECKLSIEGMTASQAVTFMQGICSKTQYDSSRQILSAAFCINSPIIDDRGEDPREITDPFEVALLGIELTVQGGFSKVTWDGTADTYPSKCFIEQLPASQAITLVHKAHENGLLTYFSAGFRFHHIEETVLTGVDGIGIGGAQILRLMDSQNGNQGPFLTDNIQEILKYRNNAELSEQGQQVKALCRLDRMAYERSISVEENHLRLALFDSLSAGETLQGFHNEIEAVLMMSGDYEDTLLSTARRLVTRHHVFEEYEPELWKQYSLILRKGIFEEDLSLLTEVEKLIREKLPFGALEG